MKTIIVGIDDFTGSASSDSSNLSSYFELGWEIMTTHLKVKEMLYIGSINSDDTVVTCKGREFLYKKLFNNVICWSDFKNLNNEANPINLLSFFINDFSNLQHIENNPNEALQSYFFSFENNGKIEFEFPIDDGFVCMVYRERNHDSHRNMDKGLFSELIYYVNKVLRKKAFVVGFNSESFCDNIDSFHVSLKDFTSLINHKNCKLCLSSLTGPPHLTYFFGNQNMTNIILDLENARANKSMINHPLAMGDQFNFKKIETHFISDTFSHEHICSKVHAVFQNDWR
jgi:hypothetical protein